MQWAFLRDACVVIVCNTRSLYMHCTIVMEKSGSDITERHTFRVHFWYWIHRIEKEKNGNMLCMTLQNPFLAAILFGMISLWWAYGLCLYVCCVLCIVVTHYYISDRNTAVRERSVNKLREDIFQHYIWNIQLSFSCCLDELRDKASFLSVHASITYCTANTLH